MRYQENGYQENLAEQEFLILTLYTMKTVGSWI